MSKHSDCLLLALLCISSILSPNLCGNLDSAPSIEAHNYYIDNVLGLDTNDGSIEAPFASFEPLQKISDLSLLSDAFNIHISPGSYPVSYFSFASYNKWTFKRCEICPGGAKDEQNQSRPILLISMPSQSGDNILGVFQGQKRIDTRPEPTLQFINIEFRPASDESFNIPVFWVESSGLLLDGCLLTQFHHYYSDTELESGTHPYGAISPSNSQMHLLRSEFINNSVSLKSGTEAGFSVIPMFGQTTAPLMVIDSRFEFNSIVAPAIQGGLLHSRGISTVRGCSFVSNSGYATQIGVGMVIVASSLTQLEITNTSFINNELAVLDRQWDVDLYGPYGVTYGTAIGVISVRGSIIIQNSSFIGNMATQGGAIAVGLDKMSDSSSLVSTLNIHLSNLLFERNNATSGIGAAILLRGSNLASLIAENLIFDGNVGGSYGVARKVYPGVPPLEADSMDASVIFGVELSAPFAYLSFVGVVFRSSVSSELVSDGFIGNLGSLDPGKDKTRILPQTPKILNPYEHVIHRTIISGIKQVVFEKIRYEKVEPADNSATGSLLALTDVFTTYIDGIVFDCVVPPLVQWAPIWKPWNPGPLIFLEDGGKTANFFVSGILVPSWPHGGPRLVILAARGMDQLYITSSEIGNTAHTTEPLFLIDNVGLVTFSDSRIYNFTGPIQISNSERVLFEDMEFNAYVGNTAMIQIDQILNETRLVNFVASNSTASFILATSFSGFVIESAVIDDAMITSLDAAITLVQGNYFKAHHLMATSIQAVQGAVISTTLVETVSVLDSSFVMNRASQSGGVIHTDTCAALSILHSAFTRNSALNGNGGAVSTSCIAVSIEYSLFRSCEATNLGGAVHAEIASNSEPMRHLGRILLNNSTFSRNRAGRSGGAVSGSFVSVNVLSAVFEENMAVEAGGAVQVELNRALGQGISFSLSRFFNNSASNLGGAVVLIPYLRHESFLWRISLNQCRFERNSAASGGAIASHLKFDIKEGNNVFVGNMANSGGCVWMELQYDEHFEPIVSNQTFEGNRCRFVGDILSLTATKASAFVPNPEWLGNAWRDNTFIDQPPSNALIGATFAFLPVTAMFIGIEVPNPSSHSLPLRENQQIFFPGIALSFWVDLHDLWHQPGIGTNYSQIQGVMQLEGCYDVQNQLVDLLQMSQALHLPTASERLGPDGEPTQLVLNLLFTLAPVPDGVPEPLQESLKCQLTFESVFGRQSLNAVVAPCGLGTGLAEHSSECQICPLGSYSLQGTCISCAEDPHVECFGGSVLPIRNYWVDLNFTVNQYQVLRCPNGFCTPNTNENDFSPCSSSRMGPMCGECRQGLHESLLSQCLDCNKPNWTMICLVIGGLWISVLILHSLVAVSSGKATILIFFIQSCFIINYQIPITDIFGSNNKKGETSIPPAIAWILCIVPLNALDRTLIFGMVPFIMIAMLSITFGVRIAMMKIFSLFTRRRPDSASYTPLASSNDDMHFDPSIQVTYEEIEEDGNIETKEPDVAGVFELETDHSENEIDCKDDVNFEFVRKTPSDDQDPEEFENVGNPENVNLLNVNGEEKVQKMMKDQEKDRFEIVYRWQQQMAFWHPYRLIRTVLSLLAGSFSSVLGISISTMDCVSLLNGQRVLQSAPSIMCDSGQFTLFRILNGIWVPYMVFLFLGLLWKLVDGYRKNVLSAMDVRFGVWYEMYKPKMFAWKLTEMIRRLVLSFAAKLLLSSPMKRSISLFAICIGFLAIHLMTMPYRQKLENSLETLSLTALAFISLVNIWNAQLFSLVIAPKGTFVLAWVTCFVVAAAIVGAIIFIKVKGKATNIFWFSK